LVFNHSLLLIVNGLALPSQLGKLRIADEAERVALSVDLVVHRCFVVVCREGAASVPKVRALCEALSEDNEVLEKPTVPAYEAWQQCMRVATSSILVISDTRAAALSETKADKKDIRLFLNGEYAAEWTPVAEVLEAKEPWKGFVEAYRKASVMDMTNGPLIKAAEERVPTEGPDALACTIKTADTWMIQARPLGLAALETVIIERIDAMVKQYFCNIDTASLGDITNCILSMGNYSFPFCPSGVPRISHISRSGYHASPELYGWLNTSPFIGRGFCGARALGNSEEV